MKTKPTEKAWYVDTINSETGGCGSGMLVDSVLCDLNGSPISRPEKYFIKFSPETHAS